LLKIPKAYFKVKLIYFKTLNRYYNGQSAGNNLKFIVSLETIRLTLKFINLWWRYSPVLVEKPRVKGQISTNLNNYIIYNSYY
jgi:hypothetical protein